MSNSEEVILHGGPQDTYKLAIPRGWDFLEVLVAVNNGKRKGQYTRVRTVGNAPTSDFEWIGFTEPWEPLFSLED